MVLSATAWWLLLGTFAGIVALGLLEAWAHRRALARIGVRIHVNGTRGKSSVTRLIAAGLRAGGHRTMAKVTGVLPRVILPDGSEVPVYRPARANIIEQRRIVGVAARNGCDVLVIECMALQPALQWLSEEKLVRATHGVITNAREDHLDVMGPTERDVAWCLAGMVPRGGVLYTAERRNLDLFAQVCADRDTALAPVDEAAVAAVTDADLAPFAYVEHPDNVALALAVCGALGVPRDVALAGMWAAPPDPGVTVDVEVDFFGRRVHFVNGFSANDPESTGALWARAVARHDGVATRVAVFNCRADRQDRSMQLARAYAGWAPADHVLLIGTGTSVFARALRRAGVSFEGVHDLEGVPAHEVFEEIMARVGPSGLVVGMANIAGPGLALIRAFQARQIVAPPQEVA